MRSAKQKQRNQLSTAALYTKKEQVVQIEQKFSEPGHGNLQEVDAAHSVIERNIKNVDIYSPLGLLKILLKIRSRKNTFKVLQMKHEHFFDYKSISTKFQFNTIPYNQIKQIVYNKSSTIAFRKRFTEDFTEVTLCKNQRTPRSSILKNGSLKKEDINDIKVPQLKEILRAISARKFKDLKDMLKYMEEGADKTFYNCIIKNLKVKK